MIEVIKNDTIIICSLNNKKILLDELNRYKELKQIKFLTINELYDSFIFTYNKKTIYNLMNKYNIKYDVAKVYLDNLIYLSDNVSSNKIDKLNEIKAYLEDNNLLIKDEYFKVYIKNKDIVFYGYDIDKFTNKVIEELKKITNVIVLQKEINNYIHDVIEFKHIEEEVEFVAHSICELINNGVDIDNIKLTNVNEEYYNSIKRIFKMYNLSIELDRCFITDTITGQAFINNYESNLNNTINYLKQNYNRDIINQIINVINDYYFEENKLKVKDMLVHDLNNTKIKSKYTQSIKIIDYNDLSNDDYVFMMNFNQGSIPKIIKDESYLTNNDRLLLGIDSNVETSKRIKQRTINIIKSIKNLVITYKLESYTNKYFPSNLIEEMGLTVIHKDINMSYSNLSNKVKLCKEMDKYYKYNIKSESLSKLLYNYTIPYRKYSNKFTPVSVNKKIVLSYSSMQEYNECAFKYYINNILKLDPYEETFSAYLGKIYHHLLEINPDTINVEEEIDKYIKELNAKELFFVNKLMNEIDLTLNIMKENMKYTKLDEIKTENKFEIIKDDVVFKGFIDKMMYKTIDDKTIVALIDYKTYDTSINLDLIDYGLNIQLPIYLYLVNNEIKDVLFAGFYVQKVLTNGFKYDGCSIEDKKRDSLKLVGYSNSDENILKLFDDSYKDSNVIKGMHLKVDGNFSSTSNVLTSEQMSELCLKVDNAINNCIDNIKNNKFDINPKIYNETNISCKYCKYKDLCFKTICDEVEVSKVA